MNHLEIYKELKKDNCGYCQERTCMAFALAVARGEREIGECPAVSEEIVARYARAAVKGKDRRDGIAERMEPLRREASARDFPAIAGRLGGHVATGKLCIPVLGREFRIDRNGDVESDVHVNPWVMLPLLNYVAKAGNGDIKDDWISFEELSFGTVRGQYFVHRCEKPLKHLIDAHEDLFNELMEMFGARSIDGTAADRGWLLLPLPKVPVGILYWRPEEGIESRVKLVVDRSVERFLDPESVGVLARGMVEMFERLISRHAAGDRKGAAASS